MLLVFGVQAQNEIPSKIITIKGVQLPFQFKKFEKAVLPEELSFKAIQLKNEMLASGYATASIDSFYVKNDTAFLVVFVGEKYKVNQLNISDSSVNLSEKQDNISAIMYNSIGEIVLQKSFTNIEKFTLNIKDTPGVYILKLEINNEIYHSKIILK